jgi:hypothetical protein
MTKIDLSSYSRDTLKETLRVLKDFVLASKQIGKRAILSDPKNANNTLLRIEHGAGISKDVLENFSRQAISQYYPEYKNETLEFFENPKIT